MLSYFARDVFFATRLVIFNDYLQNCLLSNSHIHIVTFPMNQFE